ncbi:MAG: Hsp20/alpha crystallin family protein, partial [Roseiflexaceae bacterium]
VEVAVPGLKPEDLQITFENNVLAIKGQLRQESEDKKRNYHRSERRYGSFQRTIALPSTVKADAIQAALTNGILRLDIPKAEEVKPRRITVQVGSEQSIEVGKN